VANKTAIVTGAASGIGRSTLLRLANDGYVVIGMDRDADGLQKITEEIKCSSSQVI
jgi:NADP-dependent 3-hydroxy acid dehydrogenase YdfG